LTSTIIKEIKYGSEAYEEAVHLRDLMLRQPLGIKFNKEELLREKTDIHIACFQGSKIIGTVILTPKSNGVARIRQVAVETSHQGKGIGRKLIAFAEKMAKERKFSEIILSARTNVLGFYKKMGYETRGNEYISQNTNVPHFRMVKNISHQH